jgi:hypothetical protein
MIAKDGRILSGYYCAKNSPAEVKTIIEMGIKKVCARSDVLTMQIVSGESSPRTRRHKMGDGGHAQVRHKHFPLCRLAV